MFLIFVLPAALIAAFICYVFVRPLPLPEIWKVVLYLFFVFCALGLQLARTIVGGNLFAPNLPTPFLKVMVFLYGFSIIFFMLIFLAWFITPFHYLLQEFFPKIKHFDFQTLRNVLNLCLLIVAVIVSTKGFFNGLRPPIVKNETFSLSGLSEKANGMKIAFLADLHIDGKITAKERLEVLVRQTNELNPDLIVIGGDFVDGTVDELKDDVAPLKDLKAPLGVVGVVGNHEYYSGYYDWVKFLPSLGIKLLLNEELVLDNGLHVVGVTDLTASGSLPKPDPIRFLQWDDSPRAVLLIAHQPKITHEIISFNLHHFYGDHSVNSSTYYGDTTIPPSILQLSGHTHGGMIPVLNKIVKYSNAGFLSGRYNGQSANVSNEVDPISKKVITKRTKVSDVQLYVSNGTFIWNGFPFRLFCPSEISLITLKRKEGCC